MPSCNHQHGGAGVGTCVHFMKEATKSFATGDRAKEEIKGGKHYLLQDLREEKTTGSRRKSEGDTEEPSINKRPAAKDSMQKKPADGPHL